MTSQEHEMAAVLAKIETDYQELASKQLGVKVRKVRLQRNGQVVLWLMPEDLEASLRASVAGDQGGSPAERVQRKAA